MKAEARGFFGSNINSLLLSWSLALLIFSVSVECVCKTNTACTPTVTVMSGGAPVACDGMVPSLDAIPTITASHLAQTAAASTMRPSSMSMTMPPTTITMRTTTKKTATASEGSCTVLSRPTMLLTLTLASMLTGSKPAIVLTAVLALAVVVSPQGQVEYMVAIINPDVVPFAGACDNDDPMLYKFHYLQIGTFGMNGMFMAITTKASKLEFMAPTAGQTTRIWIKIYSLTSLFSDTAGTAGLPVHNTGYNFTMLADRGVNMGSEVGSFHFTVGTAAAGGATTPTMPLEESTAPAAP